MKRSTLPILVLAALTVLAAVGCSRYGSESGVRTFGASLHGMSRAEVRAAAGEPARTRLVEYGPGFGPQEALGALLNDGQLYEQWEYVYGTITLYVWFAPARGEETPQADWTARLTGTHVEGRVY